MIEGHILGIYGQIKPDFYLIREFMPAVIVHRSHINHRMKAWCCWQDQIWPFSGHKEHVTIAFILESDPMWKSPEISRVSLLSASFTRLRLRCSPTFTQGNSTGTFGEHANQSSNSMHKNHMLSFQRFGVAINQTLVKINPEPAEIFPNDIVDGRWRPSYTMSLICKLTDRVE